jgi:hypothetical protein
MGDPVTTKKTAKILHHKPRMIWKMKFVTRLSRSTIGSYARNRTLTPDLNKTPLDLKGLPQLVGCRPDNIAVNPCSCDGAKEGLKTRHQ